MRRFLISAIMAAFIATAGFASGAQAAGQNYAGVTFLSQSGITFFNAVAYGPILRSQLALSDEQIDTIGDLMLAHTKNMIETDSQVRILQIDLNDLLAAEEPSAKAIEKKIDEVTAVRAEMHKSVIRTMIKVADLLTEAQMDKVELMLTRRAPAW